jgi:thiol-disulfide isomerase/thioredoxin
MVAILLVMTGCAANDPNAPVTGGGQQGYPDVGRRLTQIPPDQRRAAPEVSGPALGSDRTLSSTAYPGKVVVLNVWGSWCGPCRTEAPDLELVAQQTAPLGAAVLGIDVRDDRAAAADFVRDRGLTYASVYDPPGRSLAQLGGVPRNVVPLTIVLDREHRVAAVYLRTVRVAELIALVQRLAAEPPAP